MKNLRNILPLALLLITTITFAQINLGVRTGVNYNNVNETAALDAITPDFKTISTLNIGAVAELELGKHFAFQPELSYTQKGFSVKENYDLDLYNLPIPLGVKAVSKFNYIEAPLLLKAKIGNEKIKAYFLAGPAVGYAVKGHLKTYATAFFDFKLFDTNIDLNAINYERLELSGIAGIGTEINIPTGKIFFDARYQHGFTQLYDIPVVNEKIKNQGLALSAGYLMSF